MLAVKTTPAIVIVPPEFGVLAKVPVAVDVVKAFRAKNIEPEGYVLYTYGAIQAWADAVKKAGAVDTAKVLPPLKSGKFETVLGTIGFDAKGDVTAPGYVVYEWKNGKYDYVTN